jgi:hypothetical protein
LHDFGLLVDRCHVQHCIDVGVLTKLSFHRKLSPQTGGA